MLVLLLTCTMVLASSAVKDTKDITIDSGTISGINETLSTGQVVHKYLGIPYAKADRFEKPVNVTPWKGVKKCESFGPVCYQKAFGGPFGLDYADMSEDCLNLNVYVPSDGSKNGSKPVMFWIHGGYQFGSGRNTNGSYLAGLGKVIVVTFNYRLLSFGWLSDRVCGFKGNNGLYDQLAALKWVNRNIAKFGGDPNRVTIFGHSFGGISVSLLSLSPLAKGLFKYSIMQSGSSLGPDAFEVPQDGELKREMILRRINCAGHNSIKSCMKSIPAIKLADFILPIAYLPVVDGEIITDEPSKLLQNGNFSQESTLMGVAMNDGSTYTNGLEAILGKGSYFTLQYYSSLMRRIGWFYALLEYTPSFFSPKCNKSAEILGTKIKQEYSVLKNLTTTELDKRIRTIQLNVMTDFLFAAPAIGEANYYANKSGKMFFYQVEYGLKAPNYFKHPSFLNNGYFGTDKFMVFGLPLEDKRSWKTNDGRISREVIKMWSNFAKTGNPNTPDALDVQWPQYHVDTQQYMSIKPNMTVKSKLRPRKMWFWNQFIAPYVEENTRNLSSQRPLHIQPNLKNCKIDRRLVSKNKKPIFVEGSPPLPRLKPMPRYVRKGR